MKTLTVIMIIFGMVQFILAQEGVGVGTTSPNPSAALDVTSVTQGMLVPRMTSDQRVMISSPAQGLLVFDLTTNSFWFRNASSWVQLVDSVSTEVHRNGLDKIYMGMLKNVGIGMDTPLNKLDIEGGETRTGSHPAGRPLYVTGDIGDTYDGIEFRHDNGTQGIGFGYNTIYAASSVESQNLGLAAKGPDGNLIFSTIGLEKMRIVPSGNVGIGTLTPNAPLQLNNAVANRKVVLYESANNDHQFYGFGINGATLRYQVDAPFANHTFYAGTSTSDSKELMRIQGNGYVGIGQEPSNQLDIQIGTGRTGVHATGRPLYVTGNIGAASNGIEFRHETGTDGIGFGYNTIYAAGSLESQSLGMAAKGSSGSLKFNTNSIERMQINSIGNVGIGQVPSNQLDIELGSGRTGSHASGRPLYVTGNIGEASNGIEFRHENGTQGIGFGYNTIYAANSDESQNLGLAAKGPDGKLIFNTNGLEKMRIAPSGNIGIGTVTPNAPLQLNNAVANRKVVLYESANNDHQFYGFGINGYTLRYQVSNTTDNHIFYAGTSDSNSSELMRIQGNGNVGIGTATPAYKLSVTNKFGIDANGSAHFINVPRQLYFYEDGLPSKMILSHSPSYPTWGLQYTSANQFRFLKDSSAVMTVDLGANNVSISGALKIGYVRVFGPIVDVYGLSTGSATCNCPSGLVAIGGGFWESHTNSEILQSYPNTDTSWYVSMYNSSLSTHQLQAIAVCARLAN